MGETLADIVLTVLIDEKTAECFALFALAIMCRSVASWEEFVATAMVVLFLPFTFFRS
jgi:hypothetical protein